MRIIYRNPTYTYMDKEYMEKNHVVISNKYIHRQSEEDIEKLEQYKKLMDLFA